MKRLSVNCWALDPAIPLNEQLNLVQELGFQALEINFEEDPDSILNWETTQEDLEKIKILLKEHDIKVSSVCSELFWKYSLTSEQISERDAAIQLVRKMIDAACVLEARSIVVIPGIVDAPEILRDKQPMVPSSLVWEKSTVIRELAAYAKEKGVVIGIENVFFNSFLMSPMDTKAYIKYLNHENIYVHLDLGNAHLSGNAEDWIITLGELIGCIHIKDAIKTCCSIDTFQPFGQGDIDWKSVKKSLETVNYQGFLVIEQSYKVTHDMSILSQVKNFFEHKN